MQINNNTFYVIVENAFAQLAIVQQDGSAAHTLLAIANIYASVASLYVNEDTFDNANTVSVHDVAKVIANNITYSDQASYFYNCFKNTNIQLNINDYACLSA